MAIRLTQLQTQRGALSIEALARKANMSTRRIVSLEGIGPVSTANPYPTADHADPFEEKLLEAALGVGAGGLR